VTAPVLRVVSVPSGHPYVEHLSIPADLRPAAADARPAADQPTLVRLPDVPPPGAAPGQWWPPVVFDAAWLRAHAPDFDLLHLHFGVESFSLAHVDTVVAELRALGTPFVFTVHDLENPQLTDQTPHVAQLDRLIGSADGLVTLTDGAADEIAARWGRRPVVVPHPNVLPFDAPLPIGRRSEGVVVGMHLRDLRPNIDAVAATETLVAAVEQLRAGGSAVSARIHLNDRVRDPAVRDRVVAIAADRAGVELVEGPRLSDEDLAASLADLDVAVLPYRHGTHSGWVELCHDLGVAVVGPRVGYAGEQHPASFRSFDRGVPASLAAEITAVRQVATRPGSDARAALVAARREERRAQRIEIDEAHRSVYAAAAATAPAAAAATAPAAGAPAAAATAPSPTAPTHAPTTPRTVDA
jgi:hypothetical protein